MKPVALAASTLVAPGKGILAADESIATMSARLAAAGITPSQQNRRAFREMLITTPGLAPVVAPEVLWTARTRWATARRSPPWCCWR